jgi:hypothetical protein
MRRWSGAVWLLSLALAAGCGSSPSKRRADASLERHLLRGVAQIRTTRDKEKLHAQLGRTLATLRHDHASTPAGRRAKRLAIDGFEWTRKGVRSLLDFEENDSGNVAAATRDAIRADRFLKNGANRLRSAGTLLGIRVGRIAGH